MKLVITADDYGMTYGVTDGIVAAGREGLLTQTGLFTNMPTTEYAVKRWKEEIPHVSLGQDLNLSTGSPVTDPKLIPTLVNPDGTFLTSTQHRRAEVGNENGSVRYEDAYLEYENQVKRFLELVGKKPDYIQGHAWYNEVTQKALRDVADKYGIRTSESYVAEYYPANPNMMEGYWSKPIVREDKSYDYSIQVQIDNDPVQMLVNGELEYLEAHKNEDVVVEIHTHTGFTDRDLIKLSSFTGIRAMEEGLVCSEELRNFVEANNIKMVSFADLAKGE
ncbi:MAG: ChbG/HpnK family deacetylase [Erysipelotrichaceae bacterium]|nr:ChbG/HpnK family deacetylase [Erysipelotrichaceae bacterium]